MVNRFEELRYKDKLSATPFISMSQLAKELDISKATVSKLEHDEDYDARISIIKKYKERFPEVSYDYLLGATGTRHKQYSWVEEELPFSNEFYDNLKKIVITNKTPLEPFGSDTKEITMHEVEYMLEAILHNPDVLARLLGSIYYALEEIYLTTHGDYYFDDVDLGFDTPVSETMNVSRQHFYISRIMSKYLDEYISPLLEGRFERELQKKKREREEMYKDMDDLPFE